MDYAESHLWARGAMGASLCLRSSGLYKEVGRDLLPWHPLSLVLWMILLLPWSQGIHSCLWHLQPTKLSGIGTQRWLERSSHRQKEPQLLLILPSFPPLLQRRQHSLCFFTKIASSHAAWFYFNWSSNHQAYGEISKPLLQTLPRHQMKFLWPSSCDLITTHTVLDSTKVQFNIFFFSSKMVHKCSKPTALPSLLVQYSMCYMSSPTVFRNKLCVRWLCLTIVPVEVFWVRLRLTRLKEDVQ